MFMDPVHSSVDHGRHRSTVDHGQGLGSGSSEDGWNSAPMRGSSTWLRKKGEGTAVILTSGKRGGAWARREEKRGGERFGEARGCAQLL
jgi:hypothetical protein